MTIVAKTGPVVVVTFVRRLTQKKCSHSRAIREVFFLLVSRPGETPTFRDL